jgi:type IV pilus assembly protein PilB
VALKLRLGERLVQAGLLTPQQLEKGLQVHAATGDQIGRTLVKLGYLDEDSLVRTLCADAGIPYLTLTDQVPEPGAIAALPAAMATQHAALPLRDERGRLLVAMADPFNLDAVTAVEHAAGRPIKVVAAPKAAIATLVARSYNGGRSSPATSAFAATTGPATAAHAAATQAAVARATVTARPAPISRTRIATDDIATAPSISGPPVVVDTTRARKTDAREPARDAARDTSGINAAALADDIIKRGLSIGATDIHIEPAEEDVRIRYRLDGLLQEGSKHPKAVQAPLMSRVKIVAGLDIAETRLPQDGRIRFADGGRNVDIRVSTYPTIHGEDIVLRLLDKSKAALDLDLLGMDRSDLALLRVLFRQPHGLVAVTGPTGSGKTTTLYAGLVELNTPEHCIMTLEDPVEYELPGVRQSQINPKAGVTFASGLRSILRHDPDIILVGEIRDRETLQIALSAALTGHLVLTTLHTTTAAGAIPRLLDMGAEPFVLASSLQLAVSQRLVRVLCEHCKVVADLPAMLRERYDLAGVNTFGPRGCPTCNNRGYKGRSGIFELVPVTQDMLPAIYERRPAEELHRLSGRPTILDDGLRKVRAGVTSLEELLRVIVA